MLNLWTMNTPARFWQPGAPLPEGLWAQAARAASPLLGLPEEVRARAEQDVDELLALTLGEGRLGPDRWRLGPAKRAYYLLKPLLPRALTRVLRRAYSGLGVTRPQASLPSAQGPQPSSAHAHWPADTRYAEFQWEVMRQLLTLTGEPALPFTHFWPSPPAEEGGGRFAFVLTHDVETAEGQAFVRHLADVDESFGFRSSFNFVPERYALDDRLMDELRSRGFEIGVHGLKHDGKLFRSRAEFERRAAKINEYLRAWGAVGFRTPLTHRQAEWMQALEMDYDLSFFDTDPYEPMAGGAMSLWPFMVGRFVELPYTLVQDYTLTAVLRETTPRLWLDKIEVIAHYHGLALLNTHPDYMTSGAGLAIYQDFLHEMQERGGFWHALPRQVAQWWRARLAPESTPAPPGATPLQAWFDAGGVRVGSTRPSAGGHGDAGHAAPRLADGPSSGTQDEAAVRRLVESGS